MYFVPVIPVGTAVTTSSLANLVGSLYQSPDGKVYRLVKAGATIAAVSLIVNFAVSSGVPTWVVTLPSAANSAFVCGVIPSNQVGSAGATGVLSGDYFYLQVSGPTKVTSGETIASGALVASLVTSGKAADSAATAGVGAIGVALEAASAADAATDVLLKGLI